MEEIFDIFALPKDIIGVIFNKLDTVDEISLHRCVSKRWTELYWSCLSGVRIASLKMPTLSDAHLIYILDRINPSILTAFESSKRGNMLTKESMSLFTRCTNLRTFKLAGLDSESICSLTSLISLKDLVLSSQNITEECLIAIGNNLTKLTRLIVAASERVTRWENITNIKSLKELTVALMPNFGTGFSDLTGLDKLTFLNVNANKLKDDALERIFTMTNLRALYFTDAEITNPKIFSALENMTQLRLLHANMPIKEEAIPNLNSLVSLTSLGLTTRESNKNGSAKFLSNLTGLQIINFPLLNIIDTPYLSNLTNLHSLKLTCQDMTEEFPLERMTHLTCIYTSRIAPKTLDKLTALQRLQMLCVYNESEGVFDWSPILRCGSLKTLAFQNLLTVKDWKYLAQCRQLDDLTVVATSDSTSYIRQLTELLNLRIEISGIWSINDIALLTKLKKLQFIQFKGTLDHETQEYIYNQFKASFGHSVSVVIYL